MSRRSAVSKSFDRRGAVHALDGGRVEIAPGRVLQHPRAERMRQEHAAALHRRAGDAQRRHDRVGGRAVDGPPEASASCSSATRCSNGARSSTTSCCRSSSGASGAQRRAARDSNCSICSACEGFEQRLSARASGGMRQRVGDLPRPGRRSAAAADGRAVRRPRCADARPAQRGAAGNLARRRARPSCSSRTASPRRSSSATAWWSSRRAPGRIADISEIDLPRPRPLAVRGRRAVQRLRVAASATLFEEHGAARGAVVTGARETAGRRRCRRRSCCSCSSLPGRRCAGLRDQAGLHAGCRSANFVELVGGTAVVPRPCGVHADHDDRRASCWLCVVGVAARGR